MDVKLAKPLRDKENIFMKSFNLNKIDKNDLSNLINVDAIKKYYT